MKRQIIRIGLLLSIVSLIIYLFRNSNWVEQLAIGPWANKFLLVFFVIYTITALTTVTLLILERNRPTKTLAWLLVIAFLPIIGLGLYLFFGFNYRKRKLFSEKEEWDMSKLDDWQERQLKDVTNASRSFVHSLSEEEEATVRNSICLLLNNSRAIYSVRNQVKILPGGPQKLEHLLEDMRAAKHHIHMEYYIFQDGDFYDAVSKVMIEKAKEGLAVRLIYDDVGSWKFSNKEKERLTDAGVEIVPFMAVRFPTFTSRFNYRNHRKIVIIDGLIGYTGGININDAELHGEPQPWRDTHLRIQGDAVKMLQANFMLDWHFVADETLEGDEFFPSTDVEEGILMQIVSSGPDTDYPSIMHAYFNAVGMAREYVYIATPYFVPNQSMLTALETAALSGVDVRILIPLNSDSHIVSLSSKSYLSGLMAAGVRIFMYEPSFIHCKVLIVDDIFASVGTANMDIRSFETNFEITAVMYDQEICTTLKDQFFTDLEDSQELELETYRQRPRSQKFAEGLARLLAPML